MIRVIDRWVVGVDAKQYVVGKVATKTNKDGATEEYISNPTYHSDFASALRNISKRLRVEELGKVDGDLAAARRAIEAADARLLKAMGVFEEIEVSKRG